MKSITKENERQNINKCKRKLGIFFHHFVFFYFLGKSNQITKLKQNLFFFQISSNKASKINQVSTKRKRERKKQFQQSRKT